MSFTTGTAANHNALLHALQAYLTGTGTWTNEEYTSADLDAKSVDAIVDDGDSGYAVDDTITLTGGTFTVATILIVTSIDGGGQITGVDIDTPGTYTVAPGDPVAQGSTSGSGVGTPTFNMTYDRVTTDEATLSLRGVGSGVDGRVYININTHNDEGNDYWGWRIYGATDYVASTAFGSLPGAGGPTYYNLWDESIDYWIYQNDRRFIVVAKVGSNYVSMYAGFFLPHSLATQYPYPLTIIANYVELNSPTVNNARNSMIADPGNGAAFYRRRTNEQWATIENHDSSTSAVDPSTGERAFIWPHKTGRVQGAFSDNPNHWGAGGIDNLKTNNSGESVLMQCHIMEVLSTGGIVVGALDGVYSATGFGRSVEQVITNSGQDYRLFQRIGRTTPADYFAIEEV
jgi:hypothetical protein